MAELLVRANAHWMDSFISEQIEKMPQGERRSYEARSRPGMPIVVRPDGWQWGKEECLPIFKVRKYPGVPVEDMKFLEGNVNQDEVIERELYIEEVNWGNEEKRVEFIQSNRYVEIPEIIATEEKQKTICVPLADVGKNFGFKYFPEDVTEQEAAKGNIVVGGVFLRGVVDVCTVKGRSINTYMLRRRKYCLKPEIINEMLKDNSSVCVSETPQNFISEMEATEAIPIMEKVWQPNS